jgi:actin
MSEHVSFSSVVIDLGSGMIKGGFSGEDGPRGVFHSVVGIPKMSGLLVGMEQKERYVGQDALSKLEIMNFHNPIKNGEIVDWERFETLMHHIFYTELKVCPEEISVLVTDTPLNSKKVRGRLAQTLFETFNVEKLHLANTAMLGLYSYGKTTGIVLDCGHGVTTSVPIYEGYPLPHASLRVNFGGENISSELLKLVKDKVGRDYNGTKGKLLADNIKESMGYIAQDYEHEQKVYIDGTEYNRDYLLPDGKSISLGEELFKCAEFLFTPGEYPHKPIYKYLIESLSKCDTEIASEVGNNLCLTGGTSLTNGFVERLKTELYQETSSFTVYSSNDRQFANWVGGSIVSSLNTFPQMWVTRSEYDEIGDIDEAVDSKCF